MRYLLMACFLAPITQAQLPISVGLKAGYVNNSQPSSEILPFKGGPYAELSLPFLPTFESGLMIERYKSSNSTATVYQIPILLKKRINAVAIKPFLSGGMTIRHVPKYNETYPGITLAGGVTIGLLPIKIEPELRYTRWLQSNYTPNSQQTEFLIGIRF